MKKTSLKRKTPLKNKKPLQAKQGLNRSESSLKPRKRVKQVSDKKRAVMEYRAALRLRLIDERGPKCQLKCSPHCIRRFEPGDDGKYKGLNLHELLKQSAKPFEVGDTREVLLSCNPCNGWVEDNPVKARELGLSISKYGGSDE